LAISEVHADVPLAGRTAVFVFVAGCGESSCSFGGMLAVVALSQFAGLLGAKGPGC
jgi:hypothetical protein